MADEGDVKLPVLTVTCPSCGAGLKNTELGARTRCAHCGTELHVPEVVVREVPVDAHDHAKEAEHERAGEERTEEEEPPADRSPPPPPAPRGLGAWPALAVLAAFLLVLFVGGASRSGSGSGSSSVATSTPKTERDVELEGLLAHSSCKSACIKPCLEIKDPSASVGCMEQCDHRCRHVGKGTPAECRGRCATKCSTAPDSYRARCETDCASECP